MKTEQAKALFFAQYLGQKVFLHDDWKGFNDKSYKEVDPTYLQTSSNRLNGGYLLLRSVNQLTDEEKVQLTRLIIGEGISDTGAKFYAEDGIIPSFTNFKFGFSMGQAIIGIDYLRSIGIFLPFTFIDETGMPVTLLVEEIIAKGWAQLTP